MSLSAPDLLLETQAQKLAEANLRRNLDAREGDVDAHLTPFPGDWELAFARDGELTAISADGRFLAGCSVPKLAAQAQMKNLAVTGGAACLLAPWHAAIVTATLDKLLPSQALIVILPSSIDLALLLRCADFSRDLSRQRLFFAAGDDWQLRLRSLMFRNDGLAIPSQFVRAKTAQPNDEDLVGPAQEIFRIVAEERARELARIVETNASRVAPSHGTRRQVCVVACGRFDLFADAGLELLRVARALGEQFESRHFDPDHPAGTTTLALARAARDADAIVAADAFRGDLPAGTISPRTRWITWQTTDRPVPAPVESGDRLIVVDDRLVAAARRNGWNDGQLSIAAWPARGDLQDETPITAACDRPRAVGIIADVRDFLPPPPELKNFSSHRLLWEWLADRLRRDGLSAANGAGHTMIRQGMTRLGVEERGFPMQTFLQDLVAPAVTIAAAKALIAAGVETRLFGRGWDTLHEAALSPHWVGAIHCRRELQQAAASCGSLLCFGDTAHPIDALGKPLVRVTDSPTTLIAAVKQPRSCNRPRLSTDVLGRVLASP